MKDSYLVSVVIPTYNSEKTLAKCLESIKNQTYKNVEIIIVDNFSTDETTEIARKHNANIIKIKAIRSKARNVGIWRSNGYFVLSIDSDMELTSKVVEECMNLICSDAKIGDVVIPERSIGRSFWVKVRDFERSFYAGTEIESARFFMKDLALKVGGFDEDVTFFEESTLPQKIEKSGYNTMRIKDEILHHEDNFYLLKWLKKKYYYGKTAWKYKARYGKYGKRQMSLYRRFELFFKQKRFYSKPSLALGVIALKSLEYASAGAGYMVGRMKG